MSALLTGDVISPDQEVPGMIPALPWDFPLYLRTGYSCPVAITPLDRRSVHSAGYRSGEELLHCRHW